MAEKLSEEACRLKKNKKKIQEIQNVLMFTEH